LPENEKYVAYYSAARKIVCVIYIGVDQCFPTFSRQGPFSDQYKSSRTQDRFRNTRIIQTLVSANLLCRPRSQISLRILSLSLSK